MMNEKCAARVHCEVCGFIESEVVRDGACDFYEDGKKWRPIKTGHWIYSRAVNTGEIVFSECSVCGNGESGCALRMNYCPNCGAKMAESEEV